MSDFTDKILIGAMAGGFWGLVYYFMFDKKSKIEKESGEKVNNKNTGVTEIKDEPWSRMINEAGETHESNKKVVSGFHQVGLLQRAIKSILGFDLPISGGVGKSFNDAIVIKSTEATAIFVEYIVLKYLFKEYADKLPVVKQVLIRKGNRYFDLIEINMSSKVVSCFFDITMFYAGGEDKKTILTENQAYKIAFFDFLSNRFELCVQNDSRALMHEQMHFFAKSMREFVESGKADKDYLKSWKTLSEWCGTKEERLEALFGDSWKQMDKTLNEIAELGKNTEMSIDTKETGELFPEAIDIPMDASSLRQRGAWLAISLFKISKNHIPLLIKGLAVNERFVSSDIVNNSRLEIVMYCLAKAIEMLPGIVNERWGRSGGAKIEEIKDNMEYGGWEALSVLFGSQGALKLLFAREEKRIRAAKAAYESHADKRAILKDRLIVSGIDINAKNLNSFFVFEYLIMKGAIIAGLLDSISVSQEQIQNDHRSVPSAISKL